MPQMGVSVAEGTVVEWKKQPGDWVERDEIIASISTDKIDTDVEAPAAGACRRSWSRSARRSTSASCWRGSRPTRSRARRTPRRASRRAGHLGGGGRARGAGRGRRAVRRHRRGARRHRPARHAARSGGPARAATRPSCMRIAAEHGIDLEQVEGTGRGGRVRKQDVLAYLENGGAATRQEPPMHIESPYKPDARCARASRKAAGGRAGGQPLSRMRQSIGGRWSTRSRRRRPARRSSRPT